jgi:Ca2+/Na+ antiporter
MGNAPELIIGITALRHGLVEVLKGSIAGSVIGTLLFGVGATMIAGGVSKPAQRFDCLAVLFVPSFFTVLQRLDERRKRKAPVVTGEVIAHKEVPSTGDAS